MLSTRDVRIAWALAVSQLKVKYRHTILGISWGLLEPLLYLGVISIVFSALNRMSLEGYAVFVFCGLVPWRYLESSAMGGMESIVGGDWLLRKMHVSPFVLPSARWLTASLEFLLAFSVLMGFIVAVRPGLAWQVAALPFAMAIWAVGAVGLAMVFAVLYTFFRDVRPIIQMGLMLTFFSSPILIMPEALPPESLPATLIKWHPVTYFVALFRKPLYYHALPTGLDWGVSVTISLALVVLGASLVERFRSRFYFYL